MSDFCAGRGRRSEARKEGKGGSPFRAACLDFCLFARGGIEGIGTAFDLRLDGGGEEVDREEGQARSIRR